MPFVDILAKSLAMTVAVKPPIQFQRAPEDRWHLARLKPLWKWSVWDIKSESWVVAEHPNCQTPEPWDSCWADYSGTSLGVYAQASELNGQLTLDMELRIWRLLCWVLVQYSLTMSSFFPFGMVMYMPHHNILEVYFLKKKCYGSGGHR